MQPVFENTGPFWEKHPDAYPDIVHYVEKNEKGEPIEVWGRDENGYMVCTYA